MDRIQELEKLIKKHNKLYWIDNNPEITDEEFDKLEYELRILNPNNHTLNIVNTIDPIISTKRKKVKHDTPMLSLDKVYTIPELFQWCDKTSRNEFEYFVIQPKFDGCSADFSNGILSTRGDDGINGVDISDKIQLITLESKEYVGPLINTTFSIRGELIIKKSIFKKYKDKLLRKDGRYYKLERNATVGLLMQEDNLKTPEILTFATHNLISMILPLNELKKISWEFLIEEIKECDYPTDGLVIKLLDEEYSNSLGYTGHHPRGQIALKYGNPKAESKLINVIWQVGKNKLTPVGIINPIILAGAEINKVTLHNAKFILEKDIKINDSILIERSGEIIPHVISRTESPDRIDINIGNCPICNTELVYVEPELICENINCSGKNIRLLLDAVKRLGLENIGEPTLEKLSNLGFTTLYQLLNLKKEDILNLPGFAELSTSNLFNEIQRIKKIKIKDWKFLAALNIPGVGRGVCKKIMAIVSLYELGEMSIEELCKIPDVGLTRAIEIKECLTNRTQEIIDLLNILKVEITKTQYVNDCKKVCFTGKSVFSRDEWIKFADANNLEVLNTVTQSLDILVTNDINSNSSKTNTAKKYGIKIMTYEDFSKLFI